MNTRMRQRTYVILTRMREPLCLGGLQEDAHVLSFRRSSWLESHLLNVPELGSGF